MNLHEHKPTLAAVDRLQKASGEDAVRKSSLDVIAAIRSYLAANSEFIGDNLDAAVLATFQKIIAALASSDVPITSWSPAAGMGKSWAALGGNPTAVEKLMAEDVTGLTGAVVRKATAGLNQQAVYTRDVPQDIGLAEPLHKARVAAPRKATSLSDVTGDPVDHATATRPIGGL